MSGADSFLKPAKPLLLEMFKTRERHCPQIILWHSLTLSDLWSGNLSSLRGRFCLLQTENAVTIFRACMGLKQRLLKQWERDRRTFARKEKVSEF